MTSVEVDLLTDQGNGAVLRLPERKFPGVLIHGDTLSHYVSAVGDVIEALQKGDGPAAEGIILPAPESTGPPRQSCASRPWPSPGDWPWNSGARPIHRPARQRRSLEQPQRALANPMKALTPAEFLRTVYVGDRACKAIRIESWMKEVVLEVDEISRIRSPSGQWDFYTAEDIPDGRIVFTGVEAISFEPPGPVPNDFINEISARPAGGEPEKRWVFEASISSVAPDGSSTEVTVRIIGADIHLEDPARAGVKIRE